VNQINKLQVSQIDRDRFARATNTKLGEIQILTPNFSPLIQNSMELDIYLKRMLATESNEHLGTYVMRIFDAAKLLLPLISMKNVKPLDAAIKPAPIIHKQFLDRTIALIDPATEYLDFEFHFEDFADLASKVRFPQQVMAYLNTKERRRKNSHGSDYKKWKGQAHKQFWYDLDRERRRLNDFITDYFDTESRFETKILVPPMPFVENESLLDIAVRINNMGKALAVDRGECATYFLLSKSILRNPTVLSKITEYLQNDNSTLTLFKFKNLKLWESGTNVERDAFRDLNQVMSDIKKENPKKLFMLLEGSYQCFPSASYGFDIVSSSLRLMDVDGAFGTNFGYGGYFVEDNLFNARYEDLPEIMKNNDGYLPCPCDVCRRITYDEKDHELKCDDKKIMKEEWSSYRREHNLFAMNSLMKLINRAIQEKQIELVRERIKNSTELSNLKTLIPQHYESD
jgi:hypothetical protein